MIKKFKFLYHLRTVEIGKWLNKMESLGFNLESVSSTGVFYFKCGKKREMNYVIDYNFIRNNDYERMYKDEGFKMIHSTGKFLGVTIWGKEGTFEKEKIRGELARSILVNIPICLAGILFLFLIRDSFSINQELTNLIIENNYGYGMYFICIIPFVAIILWSVLIGYITSNIIKIAKK
ncbi:DUF2812 domain-containing protein [Clostridium chrysemydis]|uniref:DUF2812 domain-containing protein n=1 Tax=Clostridium chrysemydis TaxID=2665504 RepID=UPI003F2F94F4